MPIQKHESYTVSCPCGNTITVEKIDQAKQAGWRIDYEFSVQVRGDKANPKLKMVLCPQCLEAIRVRKYSSDIITNKIEAGYYRDHPTEFREHAIADVGLKGHPKADKAYALAYDRGHSSGYSEIYYNLNELADLLLDD